jgi:ATP-binding cassette, subfamily B, bacterial
MGFFGGLEADKYDRQYTDLYLGRRIYQYMRQFRSQLIGIAIGFSTLAIVAALRPILISLGVDALAAEANTLYLILGGLLVAGVIEYFANWLRRRLLSKVIGNVVARMRKDTFAAAVKRDLAFYDVNKTGKIVSRITSDTQEFGDVVLFTSDVVSQLVSVVFLLLVLFSRSIPLTVVLLLLLPMFGVAAIGYRNLARRVTRQGSRAMALVNDNIQESVTGISVAKNFRRESMIYSEFTDVNMLSYHTNMRRGLVLSLVFPTMAALTGIAIAIISYVGATVVLAGTITAGVWYLFVQGVERFLFPIINLASFWSQFQQGLSAAERIFALIDSENNIKQHGDQAADDIRGEISFDNVAFGYDDDMMVLKNFNLHIKPGENVAFVGHTGAGKSTIAKLVARFYEFQGGQIRIDEHDIRGFDLQSYRSRLGMVPQAPFLFSGTIMENVRYARPEVSDEEIITVANSIGNGEWLETLPNGLHSDVGERGARLSMGQRQLVSLLRVLVQKPAIFVLDEATASIDPFTEVQIQEAIEMILAQSTSILIAHRLSTVQSADRIIVLRDGGIIEEGNHSDLMRQGGHYAELYNTYFRHQSLSYVESAHARLAKGAGD